MAPDPEARIILPSLGRTPAAEMDLEIDAHLQLCIDDLVRSGMAPERARVEAERRVAALRQARPALHQAARRRDAALRHRDWIGALRGDARFAVRQIRKNGTHSALALTMLAIGIGMSTAMFTLVKGVLLNPLPFPRAGQLVTIQGADSLRHAVTYLSNDDWIDWRRETHAFASVAAYSFPSRTTLVIGDSATRATVAHVSGDFFRVLQARFVVGRAFTPDEVAAGTAGFVVSERFWRTHLGSDTALAQPVGVARHRIIGVLADGSVWPADVDLWQPIVVASTGGGATRSNVGMYGIARLRPGVTQADASADVNRVAHLIRAADPGGLYDYGGSVRPLRDLVVAPDTISSLRLLMACVGVVLLIVCANFAVGTLGRGAAREHEFAVRTSLGAARVRLVVQLLVEHLVYALIGGAGGVFVGWVTVRALLHVWGEWIPRASEVHVDSVVLVFAIGVSLVVGLLAGIIPALRVSRASLNAAMKERSANTVGGRHRAASALVVAEFALAVVLVIGAGLLVRSFQRLVSRDLGFDTQTATIEVTLLGPAYTRDSLLRLATWDRLMDAYRAIPSVQSVGLANWVPLGTAGMSFLDIEGDAQPNPGAGYRTVSETYFNTIGLRTIAGRVFARSDDASAERAVVVNQAFVRRYFGSSPPIGRRIRARGMESGPHGEPAPWMTIVGVVSDLRQYGFDADAAPEMYASFRQAPQWRTTDLTVVVRASRAPDLLVGPLRAATHSVDPRIAGDATTMASALAGSLAPRKITMLLLTGFSAIALLLASLGAYAALSYAVTRRRRELAMRAALGAQRMDLLVLVVAGGLRMAVLGILIGVAAALALSRVMGAMLVDTTALDPLTFLISPAILLVAALAATLAPGLRATHADPVRAMRDS